jgi:hypothetical protein
VIAALLASGRDLPGFASTRRTRLVLIGLFVLGFLLTIVSLYVAFTPVRSQVVAGVQGRYFTPVMPLLLLGLAGLAHRFPRASLGAWLAASALALYTVGLLLSYHVVCGSQLYQPGLCFQPEYKNWAPEEVSSHPISPALTVVQEIVPVCNGMQQVQFWVNSPGTDPNGETRITLRAPHEGIDLAQRSLRNAEAPEGGWVILSFTPQKSSRGNLYLLTISGTSPGGIELAYSARPEYLKGKLFENARPLGQDLLFQYGCLTGLQEALEQLR